MEEQLRRSYGTGDDHMYKDQKVIEEGIKIPKSEVPFYKRSWFKKTARSLFLATTIPAIALSSLVNYQENQIRKPENSDASIVSSFCNSKEFRRLEDSLESPFFFTLDYIARQPDQAHQIIPAVVKVEEEKKSPKWTYSVAPIPKRNNPNQLRDYSLSDIGSNFKNISRLFAQRGNAPKKDLGNYVLSEVIEKCRVRYNQSNPDNKMPVLTPELKHQIIKELARPYGVSAYDFQRMATLQCILYEPAQDFRKNQKEKKFVPFRI